MSRGHFSGVLMTDRSDSVVQRAGFEEIIICTSDDDIYVDNEMQFRTINGPDLSFYVKAELDTTISTQPETLLYYS